MSEGDDPGQDANPAHGVSKGRARRDLLEELENLRELLGAADDGDGAETPILREVVAEPPIILSETAQDEPDAGPRAEVQGDLFDPRAFADRLLDEDWAAERERVIDDARRDIAALDIGVDGTGRALRETHLRSALAERLGPRMEQVLGEAVDQLRDQLLRVVRRELEDIVQDVLSRDVDNRKT